MWTLHEPLPRPAATKNHSNSTVCAVPNVQCDAFSGRMEEHHPAGTARSRLSLSTRHCWLKMAFLRYSFGHQLHPKVFFVQSESEASWTSLHWYPGWNPCCQLYLDIIWVVSSYLMHIAQFVSVSVLGLGLWSGIRVSGFLFVCCGSIEGNV